MGTNLVSYEFVYYYHYQRYEENRCPSSVFSSHDRIDTADYSLVMVLKTSLSNNLSLYKQGFISCVLLLVRSLSFLYNIEYGLCAINGLIFTMLILMKSNIMSK